MSIPRKTITLVGLFGTGNLGNEATLQAMIYNVRRYLPDAEVKCICTGPEDTSGRHKIPAFPISGRIPMGSNPKVRQHRPLVRFLRRVFVGIPRELLHWCKAFKTLRGTDMLLVPGTGFLMDGYTGPSGWPYDIFKWSIIAKLCRCKLLFVSVGTGPIYHPLSRWFIRSALSLADYRCYRDSFSKQYMERIGFDTHNDPVSPDLVFSLQREIIPESTHRDRKTPVIGVGLKDYYGQRNANEAIYRTYITKLCEFIRWLLKHKYTVRVLLGDFLYDSRVRKDLRDSLENSGVIYEEGRIVDEPVDSVEQLLSQIAETDMVVSPRFHNLVFALMLDKPVISLSYNEKFESLMAALGLPEYCQHIDQLDVARLIEQFIELEKNADSLRPYIKQKTEEYRSTLEKQYNLILGDTCADQSGKFAVRTG